MGGNEDDENSGNGGRDGGLSFSFRLADAHPV